MLEKNNIKDLKSTAPTFEGRSRSQNVRPHDLSQSSLETPSYDKKADKLLNKWDQNVGMVDAQTNNMMVSDIQMFLAEN